MIFLGSGLEGGSRKVCSKPLWALDRKGTKKEGDGQKCWTGKYNVPSKLMAIPGTAVILYKNIKLEIQAPAGGRHIRALISLSKIKPVQTMAGRFGRLPTAHLWQLQVHRELNQQQCRLSTR